MSADLTAASKFMSFVLRHKPEEIGLALDAEGWAPVADLVAKSQGRVTLELLQQVVATSEKKRFALSPDGRLIRASQGHSVQVDLGLVPVAPPESLYHGTATRFLDAIRAEGLRPQGRQYVHLSPDAETATVVGARHGKPVVLLVAASRMQAEGHAFYRAANGVWLCDEVPPVFLEVPEG